MEHKPFKAPKRLIIPDYKAPHEKKREAVRYNIRMKMYLASGKEFESTLDAQARKDKAPNKRNNSRVTSKVTLRNANEIYRQIALNQDVKRITTI